MSGSICPIPQSIGQHSTTSYAYNQSEDLTQDLWTFVHCDRCMLPYLVPNDRSQPANPFWLTECGHVLCNSHVNPDGSCSKCGMTNIGITSLRQDLLEPQIAPWFSNVPSTLETMARTARFQHAAVANEARFYKAKCFQQRATLEQRKVQIVTLNAERDSLLQEVLHLRSQLQQSEVGQPHSKKRRLDSGSANTLVTTSEASPYQPRNQQRGGSSLCSFTEASPRRDIMTPITVRRLSLPVGQPQPVFQRPQSVLQPAPQKAVPNLTQFAYESAPTADERQYKQQEMGSYQQYEHPNRYTEAIPQYKQKISPARSTRSQKMMPPPALPLTSFGNRAQFRPSPAKASGQNNWVDCPQQSILCEQQQQRNPRASDPIRTPFNPMRDIQMALRSNTAPPRKVTDAIVQQTPSLSRMRPFRPSSTAHAAHLSIGRNAPRGASIGVQQMDQRVASPAPKSGGGQEPKEAYGR